MTNAPELDTADIMGHAYNQGFLEGQKHNSPSPETRARFEHIEIKLGEIVTILSELTATLKKRI